RHGRNGFLIQRQPFHCDTENPAARRGFSLWASGGLLPRLPAPGGRTPPRGGVRRRAGNRPDSEVDAEADAGRALAAAEGGAEGERSGAADALAVADRQALLAALEAGADRDAATRALGAGGIDRHIEHRRAHRSHAVDAAVLLPHAAVEAVEAVFQRAEAVVDPADVEADQLLDRDIGVVVGRGQGGGVARRHVVADRVLARVGVVVGFGEGGRVAGVGNIGGDRLHFRLGQAVEARTGGALRPDQRGPPVAPAAAVSRGDRPPAGRD